MLPLFALAIFLAAGLLFLVEPLAGKIYLPLLGGSPSVWNTCVVFFQAALLLGYLYAHLTTRYLKPRPQTILHLALLAAAALTLPIPILVGDPGEHAPVPWLITKLALTMGPTFFVISATGPLLQRWFSNSSHAAARDPYFLYAASNAGSLLGLLAYPLLLEPLLTRQHQSKVWAVGYAILGLAILACAAVAWTANESRDPQPSPQTQVPSPQLHPTSDIRHPTWARRLRWALLAAVPSSLMLGVTQHISTDLAAVPLLWIIPLLLYLLSFIVAFSPRIRVSAHLWGRLFAIALIILVMIMLSRAPEPLLAILPVHLLTFFLAATMCHRLLAQDRPEPAHLTDFYLCISLGGVLGGCFNALLAPLLFRTIMEYPLMLGAACLFRPQLAESLAVTGRPTPREIIRTHPIQILTSVAAAFLLLVLLLTTDQAARAGRINDNPLVNWISSLDFARGRLNPAIFIVAARAALPTVILACLLPFRGSLRFALAALALLIGTQWIGSEGLILLRERSFFGVATIYTNPAREWHALYHGTTQHGIQFRPAPPDKPTLRSVVLSKMATTYYSPQGPIGDIIAMLSARRRFNDSAFIGLGAGTLAAYGRAGTRMTFFEIDPAIADIAEDPACFSFISDARANGADIDVVVADGRLGISATQRAPFDLIVIDAFSSDAIPIHLITREALAVYVSKLKDGGVIAFHISNRSFRLAPVLARLAQDRGLLAYRRRDVLDLVSQAKRESDWVAITSTPLDSTIPNAADWKPLTPAPGDPLWSDDYSNILSVLGGSP